MRFCSCVACSKTHSGLLLLRNRNLPPNQPAGGCSPAAQGETGATWLFTNTSAELLVMELWRKPQASHAHPLRVRFWTGSGTASWTPPGCRRLSAQLGLHSKLVLLCQIFFPFLGGIKSSYPIVHIRPLEVYKQTLFPCWLCAFPF